MDHALTFYLYYKIKIPLLSCEHPHISNISHAMMAVDTARHALGAGLSYHEFCLYLTTLNSFTVNFKMLTPCAHLKNVDFRPQTHFNSRGFVSLSISYILHFFIFVNSVVLCCDLRSPPLCSKCRECSQSFQFLKNIFKPPIAL